MKASLPEGSITLRDGRQLAYAEYGDPQGKPMFFFHGTPGSRLFRHPDASILASAGARIIAVDRPGFGRSDFKPFRKLLDWPNDVVQLADALGIDQFAVMGYAWGGPYAAVCASRIPERLTAAGLVSSVAPIDNPEITQGMHGLGHTYFSLARHLPPLAKIGCWLMCTAWRHNPDLYFNGQLNGLRNSAGAQTLLSTMKPILTTDLQEAVRAGTDGITSDLEILTRPWGFQLHVISTNVFLWHGENDTQAPLAMGKRLAAAIPRCRATFFPGEGHWAIFSHWLEIVTALARAGGSACAQHPPETIVIASGDADSPKDIPLLPEQPVTDTVDAPVDSIQGLQPVREVAAAPTPAEEAPENPAVTEEAPATIPPEPVNEAPKAASQKAAISTSVASEPELAPETPKPVSKKTSKRGTAAAAETAHAITSEPESAPEAPKPVSKKTSKRSTVVVADTAPATASEPKSAPESPKPISKKTSKRSMAATTLGTPPEEAAELNSLTKRAKTPSKRESKATAIHAAPPPAAVHEESAPLQEPSEPSQARSSSRRKPGKEAIPV